MCSLTRSSSTASILRFLTPTLLRRLDFLGSPKSQRLFESNRVSNKYQRHSFGGGRIYVCIRCTYHRSIQLKTGFLALKTHASDVHHYLKQGRVWLSEQVKFVRTRGFREVSLHHTHNVLIAFCLNSSLLAIRWQETMRWSGGILCFLLAGVSANAEVRGLRQDARKLPHYETVSKSAKYKFIGSMGQSKPDYTKPPHHYPTKMPTYHPSGESHVSLL